MSPQNGPLTFEVEARNAIDNERNVPLGHFYYRVQVSFEKDGKKMVMINPETGWSGFVFQNHASLVDFISKQTEISEAPLPANGSDL